MLIFYTRSPSNDLEKMRVPLSRVYMDDDIKGEVLRVLDKGWYVQGEKVREFETKFADFCNVKYAVATSSGTSALFLILQALGVGPGDEVMVPSFSFIASASPIFHVGARPVFVDIDPKTFTISPSRVREALSKRTKAIIPVHLFGHPCDMDPISEAAEQIGAVIIEDACQAHGAEYKGKRVGGMVETAFFSFYPTKNMTVCGDGGMVTTNDEELANRIRLLRDHGRRDRYTHIVIGHNLRLGEIQAAIGMMQLEKLPTWNDKRRKIAKIYSDALRRKVVTPTEAEWAKHVYHTYVIRSKRRDELQKFLRARGVETAIYYSIPIHRQPAVIGLAPSDVKLPITEQCSREVLSLPIYPQLTENEVECVCKEVIRFLQG